jgi:hypothetical protein
MHSDGGRFAGDQAVVKAVRQEFIEFVHSRGERLPLRSVFPVFLKQAIVITL